MKLTLSVRSFQVPATSRTSAWPPSFPSVPTSRATRVTSAANERSWSTMVLIVFLSSRISPLTSTVIFLDRSPLATAVVTSAMLRTWAVRLPAMKLTLSVRSFQVPATPLTSAWPPSLPSVPTSRATRVTSEANELSWSTIVLIGVLELEDLALDVDGDLLRQVAVGDGRGHLGDVAHLAGEVAGHEVDAVGEVLPGAGDALDVGLAAQLAFGADLAGDAGHLGGERAELVDHRVDGVLELEDLALDVDGDLLGEVAVGDGRRHGGDVADLGGEVAGHEVDAVGEVLPGARHAFDPGLPAELPFGADLAGHAGHLGGERPELVDHGVDGVLELEDLALDVDGDLLRQVAVGDGRGDLGDVAHLAGEVAGHRVDAVGEVLPGAGDALDVGLAAQLSFGADLAGDAGHLGGERAELVDHRIDGLGGAEELALKGPIVDLQGHGLRKVALGDGADDARGLAGRMDQVADRAY